MAVKLDDLHHGSRSLRNPAAQRVPHHVPDHPKATPALQLDPMSDLDLMIENGWGETPQYRLPGDWRTRKNLKAKPLGGRPANVQD